MVLSARVRLLPAAGGNFKQQRGQQPPRHKLHKNEQSLAAGVAVVRRQHQVLRECVGLRVVGVCLAARRRRGFSASPRGSGSAAVRRPALTCSIQGDASRLSACQTSSMRRLMTGCCSALEEHWALACDTLIQAHTVCTGRCRRIGRRRPSAHMISAKPPVPSSVDQQSRARPAQLLMGSQIRVPPERCPLQALRWGRGVRTSEPHVALVLQPHNSSSAPKPTTSGRTSPGGRPPQSPASGGGSGLGPRHPTAKRTRVPTPPGSRPSPARPATAGTRTCAQA